MASEELNAADQLALELTSSAVDVNRFTAHVRKRVLSPLRVLQDDLIAELARIDVESSTRAASRAAAIERLIRQVRTIIAKRYSQAEKRLEVELRDLAALSQEHAIAALNGVFTVHLFRPTLTAVDLRALVDRSIVLGEPLADHWEGHAEATRRAFAREVRLGFLQGETNDQVIRRIRGTSTGATQVVELANGRLRRQHVFTGGIMKTSTQHAETLVRTAVGSINNDALFRTYQGHSDVLRGYGAVTTLDHRTSPRCIQLTGAAWDLDGNPLPESTVEEHFPGPPPWHWKCRSILSPLTKSWAELYEESTGQRRRLLNTVPDSVRASMDGLLPTGSVRSFDDFLRIKGPAFARAKLGPGLYDLWRGGKITTAQLIDQAGRPLSLREIRETVAN